jgi:uncharacterized membrane protein
MIQFFKSSDRVFYCVSYAVFALPLILFYTYFIPAFQVPDESSHFARAYQLAQGEFFPTKQADPSVPGKFTVGGTTDPGIFLAAQKLNYMQFNAAVKLTPEKAAEANAFRWREGEMRDTRNVSVYAPTFYTVPALGVVLGQYFDLSIVESLTLSRLLSGLFAVCLVCISMLILRQGFGFFFVLMLMPMTLAQMASSSQDATCFAAAALCAALFSRLSPELAQRKRRLYFVFSGLLLMTIASARPPYAALALFYLYFAYTFRRQTYFVIECCIAFIAVCLVTVLWALYVTLYVSVPFGLDGANYAQQTLFVLQSPFEWMGVLANSWQQHWDFYLSSFIGIVGHFDTGFPGSYYFFTGLTLCLAFLMSYVSEKIAIFSEMRKRALVPCFIVLATTVAIFLVLYISWSPVRNPIVEGVQGRYFIPAVLFVTLGAANKALTGFSQIVYRCMMLVFAGCTLVITPYVVLTRYY